MSAYIIEVDDSKRGVLDPTVIGPFPDCEAATNFAIRCHLGTKEEVQGGYSTFHVIGDGMEGACDPDEWEQELQEAEREWQEAEREWQEAHENSGDERDNYDSNRVVKPLP